MKKLSKKVLVILGTAVLAIGIIGIPALANTANQVPGSTSPGLNMPYGYGMMNGFSGYGFSGNDNANSNNVSGYVYGNGYGMMGGYGNYSGYGMMGGYGGYNHGGYGGYGMMW